MSLVTIIKDYIEIVHKIIETSPAYLVQHSTYGDSTTLYFYLVNTIKNIFSDILSLGFFKKIAALPIIVPNIADSMTSEISVLDGTFHNLFTFLDTPLFSTKNDFLVSVCFEKFILGLFNSIFLWLPTSAATFICLRRFVMQGMEIGYIAAIGTMTANIFWLICVLFGIRWVVIPWMSLDILRYWLGFILLIKYFWDNRLPAKEMKYDLSLNLSKTKFGFNKIIAIFLQSFHFHGKFTNPIQQTFLFHFLLAFTEQTNLYPFLSHFSLSAQSTYLESFPSHTLIEFITIHSFYLLGIFIGSFSFINCICWFWEKPAYQVYLWTVKNFQKIRVSDMVRITHFIFQTLTVLLACASLPYFSIEYFITKPIGFLPNDQLFHDSQNNAFLTHSTSPVLYRSPSYFPRQRFFRYDDWAEYYGKNTPLDTSLYDQGAYRLYPMEDLHYGTDYEWIRRRSNHVKIRSRMKRIMWFPRNWATQIWDLAKTWSRRNVAWRNEILSQYQNNWDSKSAPFWEQIVREELVFRKKKSHFQKEIKTQSPWASSQNWSQKFFVSGEGFWWNWWSKNIISDNKIWWNWILTKKNQIIINNSNELISDQQTFNKLNFLNRESDNKNNQPVSRGLLFSNYQKLPSSYRLDYWLPQERIISLYSEQSQRQKNQLIYEISTLRKLVRKINKRVHINYKIKKVSPPVYTIFSIKNAVFNNNKFVFSNSLKSLKNNLQAGLEKSMELEKSFDFSNSTKNRFYSNQKILLGNQLINSNKILNSLLNGYSLANQSNSFNKLNNIFINSVALHLNHIANLQRNNKNLVHPIQQYIPTFSTNNNFFSQKSILASAPPSSFFLTLPAQYYLHREQSFSRKLQFYGVRTSREFKTLNNSPIFNFYMKTYFHQYKPTRLYIANTKMKRDLGAGGRNRFKSRQYANKQLKKARILSKTPWIRQWISQSGFLTRRKRLESWIRSSHYNSNEIWAFILKTDIDNFIKRQPNYHLLTNNEERLLHLRRFLLGEHYETLRWYSYMQHNRSMKIKIGGTKSFINRMYNQQFKGTFHKVRHLFALTPSLNGGGILTFDQLLYNEFTNDNNNSIFKKELIHEELLSDRKININSFLVKDKKTQNLNFNLYSNDLIIKISDIIKEYQLEIMPSRQKLIQKLLKDKNYVDLTNLLWSEWTKAILYKSLLTNQISKRNSNLLNQKDLKEKSIRSSFSIDQQKKFQSMLIFMFNKRQYLAKDYKRGSERLWKKWRKQYLIQKQVSKQKNIGILTKNQRLILSNNFSKNSDLIEQNETLPIYRKSDQIQKTQLYYKNILKSKEICFSYQNKATIRKALKNAVSIQKYIFNNNIRDFGFSLMTKYNNLNKKFKYNNKKTDKTNINVETILNLTKENFHSGFSSADKTLIKKLINTIYTKIHIFNFNKGALGVWKNLLIFPTPTLQIKFFTLDYWYQNLRNIYQKHWHVLNFTNQDSERYKKINKKNYKVSKEGGAPTALRAGLYRQEEIFNLLSYLQNQTIRQRLDINKKMLTLTNYNQIDSKFVMIRASRHLKRARISQRKKLSQPIQKHKNFFHNEGLEKSFDLSTRHSENLKKLNPFKIYQTWDSSISQFTSLFNFKEKLSTINPASLNSSLILNLGQENQHIYKKIKNLIESYNSVPSKIALYSVSEGLEKSFDFPKSNAKGKKKNGKKAISNIAEISMNHSNLLNFFQPFLEYFYYIPRLSTLWQSNLINPNINRKSKIDMGSIYDTKQYFTPIGMQREIYRQNFNTKNKIQDNIKRKLLDNHLNRFSERRRWTNHYQTMNREIKEQLKKLLEIIKQKQDILINNQKVLNQNSIFHKENIIHPLQELQSQSNNYFPPLHANHEKKQFLYLHLKKTIDDFHIKEIEQLQLLSSIIGQKDESKSKFSLLSLFRLNYIFNKLNHIKMDQIIYFNKSKLKDFHFWNESNTQQKNRKCNDSKIKELIINSNKKKKSIPLDGLELEKWKDMEKSKDFSNPPTLRFKNDFFDIVKLNSLVLNYYPEIKKEKHGKIRNLKKLFFTIIQKIQPNIAIQNTRDDTTNQILQLTKSVEYFLITNILQKIEKQLQQLESRLMKLSKMTNEKEQNTESIDFIQKQKKIITKRIEFLTNLNQKFKELEKSELEKSKDIEKLKDFSNSISKNFSTTLEKSFDFSKLLQYHVDPLLPLDWDTKQGALKIIHTLGLDGKYFFDFKKRKYYFSKKSLNFLVKNCNSFIHYLDLKKENDLKKQNKIFFDLLKSNLIRFSENQIKEEINQLKIPYLRKNIIKFTTYLKIQQLLKKPIIKLNNSNYKKILERNNRPILQAGRSVAQGSTVLQKSESRFSQFLSVDSSIMKFLLKKQKFTGFEETSGSLLALQKRGNALSQKNIYYKKCKNEWNNNKFNNFSKYVSMPKAASGTYSSINKDNFYEKMLDLSNTGIVQKSRIKNFLGIHTWTRAKKSFYQTSLPINIKLFQPKNSLNDYRTKRNAIIFKKKITHKQFLLIGNFIKESILKPQRFEKQQSRKRLKFKKLPRQEYFKNLQIWENSLKQKEDIKNKLFFDDLSLSFQKWKSFGFFPQKTVFQKQIMNFLTQFSTAPSSSTFISKKNNKKYKKFSYFYDKNVKTITNLDIIKQIEYDNSIQKKLNLFLNINEVKQNLTNINSNFFNNKKILRIENNDSRFSDGSWLRYASPLIFSKEIGNSGNSSDLYDKDSFYQSDSLAKTLALDARTVPNAKTNQEDFLDKDIISKIYEKFFVKSIKTTIDQSQINKKFLIGINTFPFYAGWDESLRKFVITNRLLSRRDSGYNSKMLFKNERIDLKQFNTEFTEWPLQGRNAATTFFCHFPFLNQPSDFAETIQYKNRAQFQLEEMNSSSFNKPKDEMNDVNLAKSTKFLEKNKKLSIKRIKKQKPEFRNENRRNITNLVAPNDIQNRQKAIFNPLKWRSLKLNTKKIILKLPLNKIRKNVSYKKTNNLFSNSTIFKEKDINYFRPLLSKFHLLRILRKGNTGKIRLTKLKQYKKYIKKENDILESAWNTFISKRKLRSYNFVRQKNIRTMHLFQTQLGNKLQLTKIQWLFRKNNSRANRQSENRKNKSGVHYLRPRKKSLRRRSLGIKYKRNQQISSLNHFGRNKFNLMMIKQGAPPSATALGIIDLSNLNKLKSHPEHTLIQNKIKFYETPYNWIQPNNSNNLYNILFKTSSIYTPTLYSTLPGHGRFIPKVQTMPLPKSAVQTIKRAIRLANFEPASFIQREILSYEWSMKQLIRNLTYRLNHSANRFILKNDNTHKNNKNKSQDHTISQVKVFDTPSSSFSIDLLLHKHLHLFKKKLIDNPILSSSSNIYLSQFSRQRTFQKRSIRLRKFNMTLAMNLYDRWFFYYYTGGREDPLQNLFQIFEKLAQNISSPNNNTEFNQSQIFDNSKATIDHLDNLQNNMILKSIRKFLTQKPEQKRSFNTFLTNLKTKKYSSFSQTFNIFNEHKNENILNSTNFQKDSSKNEKMEKHFSSSIDGIFENSNIASLLQWWHLFKFFPQTMDGQFAEKEMLLKLSSNKKQKKQQEKDLEEDRFYFLKAKKSPIIQDFRSSKNVNRHHPLNGGLIWPGDYLRLQTIMLPKEKKFTYFYNQNLVLEIQNAAEFKKKSLQTFKSLIDSNAKINEKIKEFQNYMLYSK